MIKHSPFFHSLIFFFFQLLFCNQRETSESNQDSLSAKFDESKTEYHRHPSFHAPNGHKCFTPEAKIKSSINRHNHKVSLQETKFPERVDPEFTCNCFDSSTNYLSTIYHPSSSQLSQPSMFNTLNEPEILANEHPIHMQTRTWSMPNQEVQGYVDPEAI